MSTVVVGEKVRGMQLCGGEGGVNESVIGEEMMIQKAYHDAQSITRQSG